MKPSNTQALLNGADVQKITASEHNLSASSFSSYHEMADVPVTYRTLEEEFVARLALVEDLHKRFQFMMTELRSAGLRLEDEG